MSESCVPANAYFQFLEPQARLKFYKSENNTNEVQNILSSLGLKYGEKSQLQVEETRKSLLINDIQQMELKLSSILDLLENIKAANGIDIGFNLSKKTLQETNFSLFLKYTQILYNSLEYAKARELLSNLIILIDMNLKTTSISIVDFTSIKIFAIWYLISIDFSSDSSSALISEHIENVRKEISVLDSINKDLIMNIAFSESSDNHHTAEVLNQIPLLKGYLINWSLLKLRSVWTSELNSNDEVFDQCLQFLDLTLSPQYIGYISSFPYILSYICVAYILTQKVQYSEVIESLVSNNHSNPIVKLVHNLYFEFDIDELIRLQKLGLEFIKSDFLLLNLQDEFLYSSSQLITEVYIKLHCSIDLTKIDLLHFQDQSGREYLKELLISSNRHSKIVKEDNNILTYDLKGSELDLSILRKAQHIRKIGQAILKSIN